MSCGSGTACMERHPSTATRLRHRVSEVTLTVGITIKRAGVWLSGFFQEEGGDCSCLWLQEGQGISTWNRCDAFSPQIRPLARCVHFPPGSFWPPCGPSGLKPASTWLLCHSSSLLFTQGYASLQGEVSVDPLSLTDEAN